MIGGGNPFSWDGSVAISFFLSAGISIVTLIYKITRNIIVSLRYGLTRCLWIIIIVVWFGFNLTRSNYYFFFLAPVVAFRRLYPIPFKSTHFRAYILSCGSTHTLADALWLVANWLYSLLSASAVVYTNDYRNTHSNTP